jgi:hypothetical protein
VVVKNREVIPSAQAIVGNIVGVIAVLMFLNINQQSQIAAEETVGAIANNV